VLGAPLNVDAALALIAEGKGEDPPTTVSRRPFAYRTSFPLEEVEIEHADRSRQALILKRIGWSLLGDEARLAKADWLFDPEREPCVYERILPRGEPGPPRLHGWAKAGDGASMLFIERVDGPVLWQSGDVVAWESVARWLARNQMRLGTPTEGRVPLVEYDEEHLLGWLERARAAVSRRQPVRERLSMLERLWAVYEEVMHLLLALPRAFVHNELFPSNVLLGGGSEGRIAPIDWELAGVGPALIDLAALSVGQWGQGPAPRLEEAYRATLPAGHRLALDDPRFAEGMAACRLHLAVRALVPELSGWTPPAQHGHDWLAEGLLAADSLGL
jgi:hypothetical protein